jgi:transcriptional regulator with XRE-family HTH domain
MKAFSLLQREFKKSGITQADLALRMGKGADRISRILGSPGNLTLDTMSEVLFALSGGEPEYGVYYPLDAPPRNQIKPEWLESTAAQRPLSSVPQSSAAVCVREVVMGGHPAPYRIQPMGGLLASRNA